jgi:lysophospholipase L1-like esterase
MFLKILLLLLLLTSRSFATQWYPDNFSGDVLASFKGNNVTSNVYNKTVKLATWGDSITFGVHSHTYEYYLNQMLPAGVYTFVGDFVTGDATGHLPTEGVSGNTTYGLNHQTPSVLQTFFSPRSYGPATGTHSIILIQIGTNGSLVSDIQSVITAIYNTDPNIDIYVALIIPKTDAGQTTCINNTTFGAGGSLLTQLQTDQSTMPNLHIVDLASAFLADSSCATDYFLNGDIMHPSDAGNNFMASIWYNCIMNKSSTYCDGH